MSRQPKAVGSSAAVLALLVTLLCAPAPAAARAPARDGALAVTADAAELARTAPEAVAAGSTDDVCTGWRSTLQPPPSIRVLRTKGPNAGLVEEVPFRTYTEVVLAAEWPAFYPPEVLKVGAIAVKQYGWYYTIVSRGKVTPTGECYDVEDNTNDQYYQPELKTPDPRQIVALDLTWPISLRKWQAAKDTSRFFLTGYRAGANGPCAFDRNGWHLFQHSAYTCGTDGLSAEQILRAYLDPRLEIVQPGGRNVTGSVHGDATYLAVRGNSSTPTVHDLATSAFGPAGGASFSLDASTVDAAPGDVDGDGYEDLVTLSALDGSTQRLSVAFSDGAGYAEPVTWWEGESGVPSAGARLFVDHFNADAIIDAGVLGHDVEPGTAALRVLRGQLGSFRPPLTWWAGALDLATTRTWAADVNGDGRADLVAEADLGEGGLRYDVATSPTVMNGKTMAPFVTWRTAADLRRATTKVVPGDYNRDGRTDLYLLTPDESGTRVSVLRGKAATFGRLVRWTSPSSAPLAFGRITVTGSDLDADGRGDLVVYLDRDADGTRFFVLRSRDLGMKGATWRDDATVDWETIRPL